LFIGSASRRFEVKSLEQLVMHQRLGVVNSLYRAWDSLDMKVREVVYETPSNI